MSILFLEYPKCTTCKKAKKWLDTNQIAYEDRDIKEQRPTLAELTSWNERLKQEGLPLKKLFNTSGNLYKELGLKDKLPGMPEEEQLLLLATDGMLVKRPLLISEEKICIGFKEVEWESIKK